MALTIAAQQARRGKRVPISLHLLTRMRIGFYRHGRDRRADHCDCWREWREHQLVGIVTQPDKPVGRDQKITPPPIKAATQQLGAACATSGCELELPVLQPARIKMPEAIEAIRRLNPDVIVVMGLRTNSSARGPRKFQRLHASICTPRSCRVGAVRRQFRRRWRRVIAKPGSPSCIWMKVLIPARFCSRKKSESRGLETGGSLHDRLGGNCARGFEGAISLLAKGDAPRTSQESELATYAAKLEREHGPHQLDRVGRRHREKNPRIQSLARRVHGAPPTQVEDLRRINCRSERQARRNFTKESELIVATGKGALSLNEVQLEGKRRMSIAEFLAWPFAGCPIVAPARSTPPAQGRGHRPLRQMHFLFSLRPVMRHV